MTTISKTGTPTQLRAPFSTTGELRSLVHAVENCHLPRAQWTHSAHVAVALWYVVWYGHDAEAMMGRTIGRYNASNDIAQTETGGYHETLTRFFVWAVRRHVRTVALDGTLADLANSTIVALADKSLPLRYYSRERLMSWEARTSWLEPDLRPLD